MTYYNDKIRIASTFSDPARYSAVRRTNPAAAQGAQGLQSPKSGKAIFFRAIAKFFGQKTATKNEKKHFFYFSNDLDLDLDSTRIQVDALTWMHCATLRRHSCLSRAATSASSQVSVIFRGSFLTVPVRWVGESNLEWNSIIYNM